MKILVAEQVEFLRKMLALNSTLASHQLLHASSADAAMRLAQDEHPDVIIIGMSMPLLNGLDYAKWARRVFAGRVKIFLIASSEYQFYVEERYREILNGFICSDRIFDSLREIFSNQN